MACASPLLWLGHLLLLSVLYSARQSLIYSLYQLRHGNLIISFDRGRKLKVPTWFTWGPVPKYQNGMVEQKMFSSVIYFRFFLIRSFSEFSQARIFSLWLGFINIAPIITNGQPGIIGRKNPSNPTMIQMIPAIILSVLTTINSLYHDFLAKVFFFYYNEQRNR